MEVPETKLSDHPTQVYLLIENRLVRETLVRLLRKRLDIRVVGESSPTEGPPPDTLGDIVILNDLQAASVLGTRLQVDSHRVGVAALILIGMEEEEGQFLTAVRSGVAGFLLNDASASEIVAAVRSVARGEAVCPPKLCLALIRYVARVAKKAPCAKSQKPTHGLTIRQQQLVSLVARGLTNKEIASQLNLSECTIKNHMHRILKQVEAVSRHEAVETVRDFGLLTSV